MSRARKAGLATAGVAAATAAVSAAGALARRARLQRLGLDGIEAAEIGVSDPFHWEAGRSLTVTADDGTELYAEIDEPDGWSDGPTVVFSHGYCLSLESWIHQRRAVLTAGLRCVVWDQRGHGRSGAGPAEGYSIDQLGRDLKAVIEATTAQGQVVLVGHSMGGMTTMALPECAPELVAHRVIAVAFVATTAGGEGLISGGFGRFVSAAVLRGGPGVLANIAARQKVWSAARRVGRDVESALVNRFSFGSPVSEETVRYAADMLMGTDLNVVGAFLPTLESHDKQEALAAYAGIPALVINGEEDLLTPPDHSLAIVDALPGSEHVVITEAGHLVMLEHPAVVNAQLLALIDKVLIDHEAASGPSTRREVTDIARRGAVALRRRKAQNAKSHNANAQKVKDQSRVRTRSR